MNCEFPDENEEYELLHQHEYENEYDLRDIEENEQFVTNKQCQSEKQCESHQYVTIQHPEIEGKSNGVELNDDSKQNKKVSQIENDPKELQTSPTVLKEIDLFKHSEGNTKKRSIDQIQDDLPKMFDATDFDDIDDNEFRFPEKKKPCWDKPEELIQLILERRNNLNNKSLHNYKNSTIEKDKKKNFITQRVPTWNFVAVTRSDDGARFYIKISEKDTYVPKRYRPTSGLLLNSFRELKDEAEQIILRNSEKAIFTLQEFSNEYNISSELWVDKYRPKKYMELLSDESVNRSLLYWLKLWDKIVFDRDPTVRSRKPQVFSKFKNKFKNKEDIPDHDSKGFPTQRIALLTGPPGLGKTTLAHVAARHAGYNVVELNASDDRGPEAFREALLASTQMRAVIDKEKRPNCLVLDEIDGAPAASIELLLKFIQGKLVPKGRNAKEKGNKENDGCRRPIICICNDLYTPSLRPLRAMALVINVPEISISILAERLSEIAKKEGLKVNSRILLKLAERSACDVRACLGILQYTGGKGNMLENVAFGLKDMRKGLFDSWKELLQIPRDRKGTLSNNERIEKVLKIVHQGESDRLTQGIFHNYPEICKGLIAASRSMEWFQFYDTLNTLVMERQSWIMMPYTNWAFVAMHLYLAGNAIPKLSYPSAMFEVNQKLERNLAILSISKKTSKFDILTLVTEVLPYLPDLLTPRLRSVNAQLYSPKEREELTRLVNLMLDFGLTFSQEKKSEGGYEYYLDPNIWDVGVFPGCKVRRSLAYAVKQIVIQELESTRLQRAAISTGNVCKDKAAAPAAMSISKSKNDTLSVSMQSSGKTNEVLPNHLRTLNPIEVEAVPKKKIQNFFHAFHALGQEKLKKKQSEEREKSTTTSQTNLNVEKEKAAPKKRDLFNGDVWYQYKEGYSNAVRRTLLMEDLL